MTAIDRAALIEQAREKIAGQMIGGFDVAVEIHRDEAEELAELVLPVIAKALLAPLKELHVAVLTTEFLPNGVKVPWHACSCGFRTHSACPTVRQLDAIEAEVQP